MALTDPDTDDRPQEAKPVEPVAARRSRLRRVLRAVWVVLGWTLVAVGAVLAGAALWIRRTFGAISVDQMLMHLNEGGTGTPDGYLLSFVWQAIVIPLLLFAVVLLLCVSIWRVSTHRWVQSRRSYRAPLVSKPPRRIRAFRWFSPVLAVAAFTAGAILLGQTIGAGQFIRSITTPLTMEKYYVVPDPESTASAVALQDGRAKNLVIIYLESGEEAFSDESLFEFDMNAPVEDATTGWAKFTSLDVYDGGGWTMAGIVGTECGVPLRGAGIGVNDINSNEIGADSSEYLPGATCLGDVLADAGYENVFLGGADASFASKRDFLRTHGYDKVEDLNTWLELGETEFSPWGLSDRRLMEHAKEEITRLHDSGDPFHMSVLTVDTHEPVHAHEYCPITSDEPMTSVVRCSMEQVAGFIDYMREMGYLDDTVVFITGDHPKMLGEGGIFYEELGALPERPLFNRLWDPDRAEIRRTSIDQLSVYATLLEVLNLGRSDGRAGVGVSALRPASSDGLLGLSADEYTTMIQSRSAELYEDLWDVQGTRSLEAQGSTSR